MTKQANWFKECIYWRAPPKAVSTSPSQYLVKFPREEDSSLKVDNNLRGEEEDALALTLVTGLNLKKRRNEAELTEGRLHPTGTEFEQSLSKKIKVGPTATIEEVFTSEFRVYSMLITTTQRMRWQASPCPLQHNDLHKLELSWFGGGHDK